MTISILHPSYGRPALALRTAERWLTRADNRLNIEYIMCLSFRDPKAIEYTKALAAYKHLNLKVVNTDEANMVVQVNYAAVKSIGDLLINVSDDFDCPEHWDTLLLDALMDKEPDYVVKTQDGIQKFIITLPIMDRAWYERHGYVYHPHYKHFYGDQELAEEGARDGKTITLDLVFPHIHPVTGKVQEDDTNRKNNRYYTVDKITHKRRKQRNFPI